MADARSLLRIHRVRCSIHMLLIAPSILIMPAYLLDDAHALWSQVGYVDGSFVRLLAPLGVA
jgi:hypothetical protein